MAAKRAPASVVRRLFGERCARQVVGLAAALAWINAAFLSNEGFYVSFHLGFAVALLAYAVLCIRMPARPHAALAPWLRALLAIVMLGAPAGSLLSSDIGELGCIALGLVSGAAGAVVFSEWFAEYSRIPTHDAINRTLAAFSLSALMRLALVPLPDVLTLLAIAAFAVAGAMMQTGRTGAPEPAAQPAAKAPQDEGAASGAGATAQKPARKQDVIAEMSGIFAEIVVLGLIFGLLRNELNELTVAPHSQIIGYLLRMAIPIALLWWIDSRERTRRSDATFRAIIVAGVIALLGAVFIGSRAGMTLSAIVVAVRSMVAILIYVRLFEAERRSSLVPQSIYGFGRGLYEVALVAGLSIYDHILSLPDVDSLPSGLVYFAIACVVVLIVDSFARSMSLPFMRRASAGPASLDELCDAAAAKYGITERENEVMRQICRGRSKRYIAEELFVTEDTVRYHVKQIYKKLDVHNRQELLDRIGVR